MTAAGGLQALLVKPVSSWLSRSLLISLFYRPDSLSLSAHGPGRRLASCSVAFSQTCSELRVTRYKRLRLVDRLLPKRANWLSAGGVGWACNHSLGHPTIWGSVAAEPCRGNNLCSRQSSWVRGCAIPYTAKRASVVPAVNCSHLCEDILARSISS